MNWGAFCKDQAEACYGIALECHDNSLASEWRTMAEDWLAAAQLPEHHEPPPEDLAE